MDISKSIDETLKEIKVSDCPAMSNSSEQEISLYEYFKSHYENKKKYSIKECLSKITIKIKNL